MARGQGLPPCESAIGAAKPIPSRRIGCERGRHGPQVGAADELVADVAERGRERIAQCREIIAAELRVQRHQGEKLASKGVYNAGDGLFRSISEFAD